MITASESKQQHVFVTYSGQFPDRKLKAGEQRPLTPADQSVFRHNKDVGYIVREVRPCDVYSCSEKADLLETWSHSVIIVFRCGVHRLFHFGKASSKFALAPIVDRAISRAERMIAEDPRLFDAVGHLRQHSICESVEAMG